MVSYIKYAWSAYFSCLGRLAMIMGLIEIIPFSDEYDSLKFTVCIGSFVGAFIIPFIRAMQKNNFKLKTIGKSNISFAFGDIFDEECFVITTDRYFDVDPASDWVADDSIISQYVNKYFRNNAADLESLINNELGDRCEPYEYGKTIKIRHDNKLVYLLVFTDREKANQPPDFYEKSLKGLFECIINENHGKRIAIPLVGGNNNISDSGFDTLTMTFKALMSMINSFEICHLRSELKLNIVTLSKNRSEMINVVQSYAR